VDGDNQDELILVSPDGLWVGIAKQQGGALVLPWIGNVAIRTPDLDGVDQGQFLVNKKYRNSHQQPRPDVFATYAGLAYLTDQARDIQGYPPEWLSYHPALIDQLIPNVMDNSVGQLRARFDRLTYAFLRDRITAKARR
jgi:hypothetical protein